MDTPKYTKGQIEAQISEAVSKFEKEYMGRGPKDIKTKIIQNHILIIIDGFLSQSEQRLAENNQGIKLIKDMRTALFENARNHLEELINDIVNIKVVSMHSDVSTKTGEKVIVLTVGCDIEERI
ncbi:hypothetical protein UF75_4673 [Desulfosporosinus sp. I2]|uniref:DUF2294 domain-containing protein n=1 Tax=unclassified Desulfosporosinus TaxID=2633794 RepID=UPI00054B3303|nr:MULTISPECIES: DUF2294 domain-containing protein [unclassified Desulfosporosinus]KJR44937.1 hypothetical protein UF75_4673 [Desulfosporosinus sp. I2]KJS46654.1 MAG: hypothetical protein VR66_24210 [Peptococcaceae bacterium BRH_c23]KJS89374.1 MAG: hypothetical protein JL57_07655 [Desulfosporosinus sp. BICA1-9]